MENLTFAQVATLAAMALAINAGWELFKKKVFGSSDEKIAKHKLAIEKHEKSIHNLDHENENRQKEIKATQSSLIEWQSVSRITLESLLALINHEIDGNGKDALKNVRNKLQNQLIEK